MQKTIDFINKQIKDFKPEIGIVLGSGLGDLADEFCEITIPYSKIPGFPTSTVQGHKGQLVFATINGKKVMMMQGRFHYYEGHPMDVVTFPIKIMKKLGIKTVILTNAAGGVNVYFKPSDLMLITDHINFMGNKKAKLYKFNKILILFYAKFLYFYQIIPMPGVVICTAVMCAC